MPGSSDPKVYEARAKQWQEAAAKLPPGKMRDAYLAIAEGHEKLAELLKADNKTPE